MLTAAAAEPVPPVEAPPSAELLLYLGEFEDGGGEFVDPMALEHEDAAALPDAATTTSPSNDETTDEATPHAA